MFDYLGSIGLCGLILSGSFMIWSLPLYRAPRRLRLDLLGRLVPGWSSRAPRQSVVLSTEQVRTFSWWGTLAGALGVFIGLGLVAIQALALAGAS